MAALNPMQLSYGLSAFHQSDREARNRSTFTPSDRKFVIPQLADLGPPPQPDNQPRPPSASTPLPARTSPHESPTSTKTSTMRARKYHAPNMRFLSSTMRLGAGKLGRKRRKPNVFDLPQPTARERSDRETVGRAEWRRRGPGEAPRNPLVIEDSDDDDDECEVRIGQRSLETPRAGSARGLVENADLREGEGGGVLLGWRRSSEEPRVLQLCWKVSEDWCEAGVSGEGTSSLEEWYGGERGSALERIDGAVGIGGEKRRGQTLAPTTDEDHLCDIDFTTPNSFQSTFSPSPLATTEDEFPTAPRPTTMRELKNAGRFSWVKEPTPGPYKYRAHDRKTTFPRKISRSQHTTRQNWNTAPASATTTSDFTLADILDFRLRLKVSRLMAIAPALPIQDLYELLLEVKCSYEDAETRIFTRLLETPQLLLKTQPPMQTARPQLPIHIESNENVKIKIDVDDPDIYLDNDIPSESEPEPGYQKAGAERGPKRKDQRNLNTGASSKCRPKGTPNASLSSKAKPCISKAKSQFKRADANNGVKRTGAHSRMKSHYSLSDFVIADDEADGNREYRMGRGRVRVANETDDEEMELDRASDDDLQIPMRRPF